MPIRVDDRLSIHVAASPRLQESVSSEPAQDVRTSSDQASLVG
jgi:hypothetical protein